MCERLQWPIADKAFDSNAIIADLDPRGAAVAISQHPRRVAMRACKTGQSFAAMIYLTAAVINSR